MSRMDRDSRRNRRQWGPVWNVWWDSWIKNCQGLHICLPTSRFTKSVMLMHSQIQGEQVQIVLEGRTLSTASLGKLLWPSGLILLALPVEALVSVCDGSPRPAVSGSLTPRCPLPPAALCCVLRSYFTIGDHKAAFLPLSLKYPWC